MDLAGVYLNALKGIESRCEEVLGQLANYEDAVGRGLEAAQEELYSSHKRVSIHHYINPFFYSDLYFL